MSLIISCLTLIPMTTSAAAADIHAGKVSSKTLLPSEHGLSEASEQVLIHYDAISGVDGKTSRQDTAAVFLPKGKAPENGWPVVVWTHGTIGVATDCAPSLNPRTARDKQYLNTWLSLLLYQADLNGSETTSKDIFYKDYKMGERLGEVDATLHIAERLRLRLEHKGITVTPEHQLKDANRCDFTCTKVIENQRRLLVTEVKGQWHKELYSAAEKQLHERYAIHPDAEQQGIYLVLWFGSNENIAGKKKHIITSAQTLKESIEMTVPLELKGLIDIFVLDVSKG